MDALPEKIVPCARWTNDCQGKQDYDGRLLSVSTRYWPGAASGHGSMTFNSATGEFGTLPYGKHPSATASIILNHGEPDEYGYAATTTILEQEFEAPTEAEVKALVERWVAEQVARVVNIVVKGLRP